MQKVTEDMWEKLVKKTINNVLKEKDLYVYKQVDNLYNYNWIKIDKGKMKEEIKNIEYPDDLSGFLRNIYTFEDEEFISIDDKIREKLEKRMYFAVKYLNNDFEDIPKEEVTKFLLDISNEITETIDRKIEEKSKKDIIKSFK